MLFASKGTDRFQVSEKSSLLRHAFSTFDSNNDGTIDFDEFLVAMAATSQGDLNERLGFAFEMYDASGDGQIDQKELANLIAAMVEMKGCLIFFFF